MTTKEFNEKIQNGEAQVLTLEKAKQLKGKRILWSYFPDRANHQEVSEMTVGNIISEWDFNKTQPMEGYASRTDYWKSYFSQSKIEESKGKLILLDEDGRNHYIYCHTLERFFDEPTFTCSDADREVFIVVE